METKMFPAVSAMPRLDAAHPSDPAISAIEQALGILGDRWVLLMLQHAFLLRVRTFARWRDELGISESVLAARLKELVAHGIFEPVASPDGRTRHEYHLTEAGWRLWRYLVAIYSWERGWAGRPGMLTLIHDGCGQGTRPYVACGGCRDRATARDTRTERGPLLSFARVGEPRHHRRTTTPVRPQAGSLGGCPVSMEILGDRWSTTVLAAAFLGVRRFVDFQRELGIAPSVLTDRLRRFCELGVLHAGTTRVYRLTDKGLAFFDVLVMLTDWAQRELPAPDGSALAVTHRSCGTPLRPVLVCDVCAGDLECRELSYEVAG
ncbi:winged helix-turn-helix transcriptional regulator [Sphaerisporangium rubeum]|uniref:DNA-binding HxlR family transcriptional regulator n=1 Tax=Sphaerisporangium rubeum TaxID=321317 RepID=A0A7X0IBT3_9ACTN|nr:DNA-binding HxlR family transcriptional regulator [Sphaerisporangium rubeum]